ncbi:MAG: formate dehydrogenase accessory sulfurtransferase FdhD, partial [Candidatus Adiutrix sp.]|nr:formate dehydrogenase accessory sulfurtransferase FdhD [Candidatus Adiutrix sp.]
LFTEGAIAAFADIKSLSVKGLRVRVQLWGNPPPPPQRARSCGFGLGSVAVRDISPENITPPAADPPTLRAGHITALMEEFNHLSELFWKTGAVHSAWLVSGGRRYFAEDVGRHNALDKVIGQRLRDGAAPGQGGLMFTTGRVSAEMLLKTAKAGLSALISRGSASRLAVDLAEKLNMVVIGFSRGDQFKAFCGGEYLTADEAAHD